MQKTHAFLLTVLVAASAALNVFLFSRMRGLEQRLSTLETKPAPKPQQVLSEKETVYVPTTNENRAIVKPNSDDSAPTRSEPRREETPQLPPPMQDAIAKEVERQLKERTPKQMPGMMLRQDPLKVMEEKLALTPYQKERISQLLKEKKQAFMKLHDEGKMPAFRTMQELEEKYETAIKNELDLSQREKYEELKKSGEIFGGFVVQFGAKEEGDK